MINYFPCSVGNYRDIGIDNCHIKVNKMPL